MAVVDPGDEVVIPVPYWVTFPQIVLFAGGTPVFAETSAADGFTVTADLLARHITDRTRVVILNSPSNPSGAVIDPKEVARVVELGRDRNLLLISDECYYKF